MPQNPIQREANEGSMFSGCATSIIISDHSFETEFTCDTRNTVLAGCPVATRRAIAAIPAIGVRVQNPVVAVATQPA
jgi:hypothetical protein